VNQKTLRCCLFNTKKLHSDVGLDGNVYSRQGQAAFPLTAVTEESVWFILV